VAAAAAPQPLVCKAGCEAHQVPILQQLSQTPMGMHIGLLRNAVGLQALPQAPHGMSMHISKICFESTHPTDRLSLPDIQRLTAMQGELL
jgi:hypothetical protein